MTRTSSTNDRTTRSPRDRRQRGTIYLIVLAVAANVLVIGLTAVALFRVRMRQVTGGNEAREARLLAQSAVEQAVSVMNSSSTWRADFSNGQETAPVAFGSGQISFTLTDDDGDLADDPTDSLWVDGIGRVHDAVWVERAMARIDGGLPLECLRTALHCRGSLIVPLGTKLTVTGAPASTDRTLVLAGTIAGSAEAVSFLGIGLVTGGLTVPVERKGMPARSLFDDYAARATVLTYSGDLNKVVLAPGVNEYDGSGVNPDGVYYLDTGGSDLTISAIRLYGTLVIDVGDGTLTVNTCFMRSCREDFPVLIVRGDVNVNFLSPSMIEGPPTSHNFNPAGAPYLGVSDADMTDTYPIGLFGLVHLIGNVTLAGSSASTGVLIVDGQVTVAGQLSTVTHDPALMLNPPLGYTDDPNSTAMIVRGGSWSRQPAP